MIISSVIGFQGQSPNPQKHFQNLSRSLLESHAAFSFGLGNSMKVLEMTFNVK